MGRMRPIVCIARQTGQSLLNDRCSTCRCLASALLQCATVSKKFSLPQVTRCVSGALQPDTKTGMAAIFFRAQAAKMLFHLGA